MDRPNEGRGGDGCGGWRDFIPAAALLVFGLAGLGMAMLAPSGNGGQYAVVAPPWYDLRQTMALVQAADGLVSGTGGLANIVVAHSDSPVSSAPSIGRAPGR